MKNKIYPVARIIIMLTSIAMIAVLFLPIWKISLTAPQYPEGLVMKIWANKLTGNIDIINGLNHYIGMKSLHDEDFIEFRILPFIIIGYALLGLLVFILNRRIYFRLFAILFVIIAVVCLADFYRWEYNYGHHLDPTAPIQVPGMAYQPPLIGYKQLLNFGAFSFPDTGGFVFAICGVLMVCTAIWEWWKHKREDKKKSQLTFFLPAVILFISVVSGCSQTSQPIHYKSDNCDYCKMTIMDPKFAGEIVTMKGRVYKFDDAHCLISFLGSDALHNQKVAGLYLTDYSADHPLIKAEESFLLRSSEFQTPMNGNVAGFSSKDSMNAMKQKMNAEEVRWDDLLKNNSLPGK